MGKEYDFEIREQAEDLYIVEGQTFEEVARATGVSVTQLKNWGAEGNWAERKREYRSAFADIRRNTVLLRKKLIQNAIESLDARDAFAVAKLEAVAARIKDRGQEKGFSNDQDDVIIKTTQDAISALQEVVEKKINSLLARPMTASLSAIKEMKQALELIEKMKAEYKTEKGKEPATEEDRQRLVDEVDKILGAA